MDKLYMYQSVYMYMYTCTCMCSAVEVVAGTLHTCIVQYNIKGNYACSAVAFQWLCMKYMYTVFVCK